GCPRVCLYPSKASALPPGRASTRHRHLRGLWWAFLTLSPTAIPAVCPVFSARFVRLPIRSPLPNGLFLARIRSSVYGVLLPNFLRQHPIQMSHEGRQAKQLVSHHVVEV